MKSSLPFIGRGAFLILASAFVSPAAASGLTLEQALVRVAQHNPQIEQGQVALQEAAGQRLVLRSVAHPDITLAVLAGVQGGERAGQDSTQPFAFAQGSLRQPLFDAAMPASLRRGEIAILLAAQQLNVIMVEQLHQGRLAFYRALYARSLEQLGRAQRTRLDENVASEEARYQAGSTDRKALTTATLLARALDPQIAAAQRAYGAALLELSTAMGKDLSARAVLPQPAGTLSFATVRFDLDQETTHALQRRPDLAMGRLLVRAAAEDERIAAAGHYPRLELTSFGRYIPETRVRQASSGSAQRSDDIISSEIAGGAAYTWRVVDNGQVTGAVIRQRAARETNQLQLQKLEQNVRRSLLGLTNQLQANSARHRSLEKAADLAQKNLAVVENGWREGSASQLEYRSAETDLLAARRGLLETAYQQQLLLAAWDRTTGRYFQFSAPPTTVHSSTP